MNIIKNWIFSVCAASIIVSVGKLILNDSKMKKTANIFFSLFLLFYMIAPFGKAEDVSYFEDIVNKDYSEEILNADSEIIKLSVDKACAEFGCISKKIVIKRDSVDKNLISKIEITLDDNTKSEAVSKKLKDEFGFEVEVK